MNILDNLPFQIDVPGLLESMHVRPGSRHAPEILRLADEAQAIAHPKAAFELVFIQSKGPDTITADGFEFKSRVMRVQLDKLERFFAYVCTSGVELQGWADGYSEDILEGFYADAVNQAVLKSAFGGFINHLANSYSLINPSAMNPGSLGDWPISQQRPLFGLLGDVEAAIGVHLKESFLMVPTKSVSGILFPAEESFASCQLCPRDNCPNRRAPYDPELFDRKYRAPIAQSDTEVPLC